MSSSANYFNTPGYQLSSSATFKMPYLNCHILTFSLVPVKVENISLSLSVCISLLLCEWQTEIITEKFFLFCVTLDGISLSAYS